MRLIFCIAGGVIAASSLGACATITRGTNTAWEINTTPPGATVKTTNGFYCESTPCALKMPRKAEFTATITHPGYKPVDIKVTNHVAGAGGVGMAGNLLLGGVIGAGVDVSTGAMLDLTPNPVNLAMEKADDVKADPGAASSLPMDPGSPSPRVTPTPSSAPSSTPTGNR